jgi:hypothetical protein
MIPGRPGLLAGRAVSLPNPFTVIVMPSRDYLPKPRDEFRAWLDLFRSGLAGVRARYGRSERDVGAFASVADQFGEDYSRQRTLRAHARSATQTSSASKAGSDGVRITSRRESETAFTFLAIDTESPYIDNHALLVAGRPEVREYRAQYPWGDDPIGLKSDIAKAVARA